MARGDLIDQGVIIGIYRGRRSRIRRSRIPRVYSREEAVRSNEPLLPESRFSGSPEKARLLVFSTARRS